MKLAFILFFACLTSLALSQRISVKGNSFIVDGKRIWISGANTPWKNWNDFGMSYEDSWWRAQFKGLHDAHVNATRVWISCNGQNTSPGISPDGRVSRPTAQFFADLDKLFAAAKEEHLYLMLALISFDHTKAGNANADAWRKMQSTASGRESFVANYVVPLVKRYGANPYFWAIDVGNELDWHWDNQGMKQDDTLDLIARVANAVHAQSKVLVCQGLGTATKYMNAKKGVNLFSDASLGSFQRGAKVDFYDTHYYDWTRQWFGSPFENTPADYGIDEKPCIVGEAPAKGSGGLSIADDYRQAFLHGWQGIMPWTSNGVDDNGGLADMAPGAAWFYRAHPELLAP